MLGIFFCLYCIFYNGLSYPKNYTIITILIIYIYINIHEYYIESNNSEDHDYNKVSPNNIVIKILLILKNVFLVLLILLILSYFDPFYLVFSIIFTRINNIDNYKHIYDILDKYIIKTNNHSIIIEEFQEHIDKIPMLK